MGVQAWFDGMGQLIAGWWQSLGIKGQNDLWLTVGWVMLVLWAWTSHRVLRHLAGHRKFGGRWYNEAEYEQLIQGLAEDKQAGRRDMNDAELQALREYKLRKAGKPILSRKDGS